MWYSFNKFIKGISFEVLTDVSNPLLGKSGATYVFSPQKGASEADLAILEANMTKFSEVCKKHFKNDLNRLLQERVTDGKQAHENMLNITNHQGNAHQTPVSWYSTPVRMAVIKETSDQCWRGWGKREPSYNVDANVNWYSHCEKHCGNSSKTEPSCDPAISLLGI